MKVTRKFSALAAAFCLIMSSCTTYEDTSRHTTDTTPLTLTESITEEMPFIPLPIKEDDHPSRVMLAVYDPFSDAIKPDNTVMRELEEAVGLISDSIGFLYANFSTYYFESQYPGGYIDYRTELERNDKSEYAFCPVNAEYAATEEELFDRMREIFTINYISNDELQETLFAPESYDGQPSYKTIDGTLCIKSRYAGVMPAISKDDITVLSYDENSAEIVTLGYGAADPPYHIFMTLKKADDGMWQLDKYYHKEYYQTESTFLYNAITLNTEKLNRILGGGDTPDDPAVTEFNDSTYIETDLDMTIDEMHDFFDSIFFTYRMELKFEEDEDHFNGMLLQKYRREYIDKVYYEEDGKLFRREDAPKWYLPELKIDPYNSYGEFNSASGAMEMFGKNGGGFFIWEQPFCDESGEVFSAPVTICYKFAENYDGYEYFYIAGDLPIQVSNAGFI